MTKEEIKNKISEHKECCKKLAEEYRQRYNEDNTDKLALNMFYHNVISYNDFETILSTIEDRNSMIMCFSNPPILTEETVEVDIKRIAELEKENKILRTDCSDYLQTIKTLSRKLKQNVDLANKAVDTVEEWKKKTEELEAYTEKMKQCGNCGNGTIGNCEHCKRKPKQKSTDTNDYWKLKEIK